MEEIPMLLPLKSTSSYTVSGRDLASGENLSRTPPVGYVLVSQLIYWRSSKVEFVCASSIGAALAIREKRLRVARVEAIIFMVR